MSYSRLSKIVMVLALAAFAFLVTFNNITDYGSNFRFVQHVMSMDTTFDGNAAMYRAVTTPLLWTLGYWGIIAGEGITGLLLLAGGWRMIGQRANAAADFDRSKGLVIAGATAGVLVWFVGFIVIGGEWFLMWQSPLWNGQDAAFRFCMIILAVLIYVTRPETD